MTPALFVGSVLKPPGGRGSDLSCTGLQAGHGMPTLPQVQACTPFPRPFWVAFTDPTTIVAEQAIHGWGKLVQSFGAPGFYFPTEVRANVGTALAANLADESRLKIGQPDILGPSITADLDPMAASVIGAIDQQPANASGAHLGEGDSLGGHAPLKRGSGRRAPAARAGEGRPEFCKMMPRVMPRGFFVRQIAP